MALPECALALALSGAAYRGRALRQKLAVLCVDDGARETTSRRPRGTSTTVTITYCPNWPSRPCPQGWPPLTAWSAGHAPKVWCLAR